MTKKKANKKTYAQKIRQAKRVELLKTVNNALRQHEKWKMSYFWTPDCNASGRRKIERENTWCEEFVYDGHTYKYESEMSVSCRNYYYSGTFTVDGVKKDARCFTKVKKELEAAIEAYEAKHKEVA